jgi:lipopolysaccharide/colanic/teichoic acid biosynthesis glycosyltransferase
MDKTVAAAKRIVDVVGAGAALCIFAPALPFIALAIYLDSPGPVFYRQRRAGALREPKPGQNTNFDEFQMFKFRTMIVDAEKYTGPVLSAAGDPRVTRIGRFLRKTRLDELPQLWNVVKGEMSLVGPRPERPELQDNLAMAIPFFEERMRNVKPGVTGLAQVKLGYTGKAPEGSEVARFERALTNPFELSEAQGAEADDMRMKMLYDLRYVASLERLLPYLRLELYIIAKTPWVMLRGVGR